MTKPTLLMSACLLGEPIRYDGQSKGLPAEWQQQLQQRYQIISICPETMGGLPTPRDAAEICGGDGMAVLNGMARVCTAINEDVSHSFLGGAQQALSVAQKHECRLALLKANSPSCGNRHIYSGKFDGQLQAGTGVTSALLLQHGIAIFNEDELMSGKLTGDDLM